ncbi:MAG: hypothetical protein VYE18_06805 [Pseudomonadota bacterium]|nr:hypothetical protein [Pseudomonadota bacterium]
MVTATLGGMLALFSSEFCLNSTPAPLNKKDTGELSVKDVFPLVVAEDDQHIQLRVLDLLAEKFEVLLMRSCRSRMTTGSICFSRFSALRISTSLSNVYVSP